jgi:hypothetical protein
LRSLGSSRRLARKDVAPVIGQFTICFAPQKENKHVRPSSRKVESRELLSHTPSAPQAGIMDLTGHSTSFTCRPRPRRPMSHSRKRLAPLLHRLMRRNYASEELAARSRPSRHAAKVQAFGRGPGLLGVCTQSQGGAPGVARTLTCVPLASH